LGNRTELFDERDRLSSTGPALNLLVEIEPEQHGGGDEVTYEIASDVWSPTMTVSSIGGDETEGEYDIGMSPSRPLKLVRLPTSLGSFKANPGYQPDGSSFREEHINAQPRGPKLGEGESRGLYVEWRNSHSILLNFHLKGWCHCGWE
jgi:hypothetical protein